MELKTNIWLLIKSQKQTTSVKVIDKPAVKTYAVSHVYFIFDKEFAFGKFKLGVSMKS